MWLNMLIITRQWVEADPLKDFHAVCNDIDIPWATKEGSDNYQRVMGLAAANGKGEK